MLETAKKVYNQYMCSAVFALNKMLAPEDLHDLEPYAVNNKQKGYIESARQAVNEIENINLRIEQLKDWEDVVSLFDAWEFDEEENELIFQTDNCRGTIFVTNENAFAVDSKIIVLNQEGNIFKTLFPNGEETELDISQYYEYEREWQQEMEATKDTGRSL